MCAFGLERSGFFWVAIENRERESVDQKASRHP